MAETVLRFALDNVILLVKEEVKLHLEVKDELRSLQNQQGMIINFLQNSEAHKNDAFIKGIRKASRDAEDVIDKYKVLVKAQRWRKAPANFACWCCDHRDVGNTIKTLKKHINEICQFQQQLVQAGGGQQQPASTDELLSHHRVVKKDGAVGLDNHIAKLVVLLTDEKNPPQRDVITITGIGGSGKTTLALNIFSHPDVEKKFKFRAFVSGSREYKIENWLVGTLQEFSITYMQSGNEQQLVHDLQKGLRGKKYLVVLDGMWNDGVWNKIQKAFPDDSKGSRILITSREKVVEDYTIPPYSLTPLNHAESWEILRKKAFPGTECIDADQTRYGKDLVKQFEGLPLAIVKMGHLFKNKKEISPDVWADVESRHKEQCLEILASSYKQLPRHLKVCFLYLGLFPKYCEIPVSQITQMWSAEGFIIEEKNGEKVTKVAEDKYLQPLIDRSLIEVASERYDGSVKTCRIHVLQRDLSLSEGRNEEFLEVLDSVSRKTPKLPIELGNTTTSQDIFSSCYQSCLSSGHSLFLLGERSEFNMIEFNTNHWKSICKSFKYIRVLCLQQLILNSIPDEIKKLILLKYLKIRSDGPLKISPDSICDLEDLQTIDTNGQVEGCLSERFWRMKHLRHLKVSQGLSLPVPRTVTKFCAGGSSSTLSNLCFLSGLAVDQNTKSLMNQAQDLFPNVEKLHLLYVKSQAEDSTLAELFRSLRNLAKLKSLKFLDFPKLEFMLECFPATLEKITIINSYLDWEGFTILGEFPNLRVLKLIKIHWSPLPMELSCRRDSFRKLRVFQMIDLKIEKWQLREGAMKKLQRLVIKKCYFLEELPEEYPMCFPDLKNKDTDVQLTNFPSQSNEGSA